MTKYKLKLELDLWNVLGLFWEEMNLSFVHTTKFQQKDIQGCSTPDHSANNGLASSQTNQGAFHELRPEDLWHRPDFFQCSSVTSSM